MEPGERLRQIREQRGLTAADLASRVGRSESAVRNQENGTNGISAGLAEKYARVLNTSAAFILYGDESPTRAAEPNLTMLPIRRRVQAGAWLQVDDYAQDEPRQYPAARDPRFPNSEQWLSEVVGDSVNLLGIIQGDLVHCVDLTDSGYLPKTGDIVEVERLRFQGRECEVTLKQVEVTKDGVELWPRSTNPRWQTPLELRAGADDVEEIEVRIRGVVIASIRRF